jgi:hypothetical protein
MQQSLSLLSSHLGVGIAEHKTDGGEEIALPGAVATNDNIVLGREGLDDGLVFVAVFSDGVSIPIVLSRAQIDR